MLRFLPKRSIFHLLSSQTRGLKFVKRIVDAQGNEDPDGQPTNPFTPQVYDLSSAEITEDSLKIDLIQTSMDKLFKKNEQLVSEISQLKEIMAIMTTSVQMLAESQMSQKVYGILKQHGLIQESKPVAFQRVNTMTKLEEYLKSYVRDTNVRGVEEAIRKTLSSNFSTNFEFKPVHISESIASVSNWSGLPYNMAKAGRTRSLLSGDVNVMGTADVIMKALHRAMRIPLLLKKFTSRVHQAIHKSSEADSLEGMEKVTIFLIFGNIEQVLPEKSFNRILTPKDLATLSNDLIDSIPGEVYIPSDEDLLGWIHKDEPLGSWKYFLEAEFNHVKLGNRLDDPNAVKLAIALLFKVAFVNHFDVMMGTINQIQY